GETSLGVEDRGGEVAARVQDLRVGGAQHGLAPLLHDGFESMLDDGDGDGVGSHARNYTCLRASRYTRGRPDTSSPRTVALPPAKGGRTDGSPPPPFSEDRRRRGRRVRSARPPHGVTRP